MLKFVLGLLFALTIAPLAAAGDEPTRVSLATATPGGGFPLFGDAAAAVINAVDPTLKVVTQNTKGSSENLFLLEKGTVDFALVAGVPAYEAFEGIRRPKTSARVVSVIYASFGMFAVKADSPARSTRDLVGQSVAWGTGASGLTTIGRYAMEGLGLDAEKDFKAVFLEKAGDGPPMLADGRVAAVWGGGIGWPSFTRITAGGGRLIGFSESEVERIIVRHPFLSPMTLPPGSYANQQQPVATVGTWSYLLARADLADDIVYRVAKALHAGNEQLVARVVQARQTTPEVTAAAVRDRSRLHPGALRYLIERGL